MYISYLVAMCSSIPHEGGLSMVVLTLRAKPAQQPSQRTQESWGNLKMSV